jgi:hypothetical protein
MEAIRYQGNSGLFTELTLAIRQLQDSGDFSVEAVDRMKIPAIIYKYTRISTTFAVSTEAGTDNAFCIFPVVNVNSPLLADWRAQHPQWLSGQFVTLDKVMKYSDTLRGQIDLSTGKVSGVFSKLIAHVAIGPGLLNKTSFLAQETAALILHEVGHMFTYLEKLAGTVSINMAIATASAALANQKDPKIRLELVYEAQQALRIKLDDPQAMADVKEPEIFQALLLKSTVDTYTHSAGNAATYDLRSCEFLSDQFAARHGAGRYLAIGLDKIMRKYHKDAYRGNATFAMVEATKAAMTVLSLLLPMTALAGALNLAGVLLMLFAGDPEARIYDQPGERLGRIKNDLVQVLKDTSLKPSLRKTLVDDIEVIDALREQFKDHRTLFNHLWIALTSKRREQYSQLRLQQQLEGLINNDLFVQASKLQTLAK